MTSLSTSPRTLLTSWRDGAGRARRRRLSCRLVLLRRDSSEGPTQPRSRDSRDCDCLREDRIVSRSIPDSPVNAFVRVEYSVSFHCWVVAASDAFLCDIYEFTA